MTSSTSAGRGNTIAGLGTARFPPSRRHPPAADLPTHLFRPPPPSRLHAARTHEAPRRPGCGFSLTVAAASETAEHWHHADARIRYDPAQYTEVIRHHEKIEKKRREQKMKQIDKECTHPPSAASTDPLLPGAPLCPHAGPALSAQRRRAGVQRTTFAQPRCCVWVVSPRVPTVRAACACSSASGLIRCAAEHVQRAACMRVYSAAAVISDRLGRSGTRRRATTRATKSRIPSRMVKAHSRDRPHRLPATPRVPPVRAYATLAAARQRGWQAKAARCASRS